MSPTIEVFERRRHYAWSGRLPAVLVARAVEGGLGDANEQAHQGDAFMWADSEVTNLLAALECFARPDSSRFATIPTNRNPSVSRKIHRTPREAYAPLVRG